MVRGGLKKILQQHLKSKATAVDFDLLEMVAVGFPKCEFDFQHLTAGHA
jgi:hypothetical protein